MSDASTFGFGKFIPGFDFLQNLGKAGASPSGLPPFAHWVAPTVSVEEVEKRIEELKSVQFWLEQNSKALAATVQALEVQKMTLSTLKGMNVNLADMAQAFPFAAAPAAAASSAPLADWPMAAAQPAAEPAAPAAAASKATKTTKTTAAAEPDASAATPAQDAGAPGAAQAAHMATALQWWGALTQQFQQIAQQAMQDPAQQQAMLKATQMSSDFAKTAVKTASEMVRQAVAKTRPAKASAGTNRKASQPGSAAAVKTPVAKKTAAAKKSAPAAKKAPAATSKASGVAAKKSVASKARPR